MTTTELDSLVVHFGADVSELKRALAGIGPSIEEQVTRPALAASEALGGLGAVALDGLARSLSRAVETGRFSIGDVAGAVVRDLGRFAIQEFVIAQMKSGLNSWLGSLFGGARAEGGPVGPGRAYLVGERGPELFVPGRAGHIVPSTAAAPARQIAISFNFPPGTDAASFRRAESQIATMLRRVVDRGARNM